MKQEDIDLIVYSALKTIEEEKKMLKEYREESKKLQNKAFATYDDFQKATAQAHEAILKKSLWSGLFFFFGVLAILVVGVVGVMWYTKDLRAEVATLKQQAEYFKSQAGKANLTTCGDEGRLCVEVTGNKWTTKDGDVFYILKGY